MITLNFFQMKWLERQILYYINEDCIALQYGFRAGVSVETALHEFVGREEHCLVRKKAGFEHFS